MGAVKSGLDAAGEATGIKAGDLFEGITGAKAAKRGQRAAGQAGEIQAQAQEQAIGALRPAFEQARQDITGGFGQGRQTLMAGLGSSVPQTGQAIGQAVQQQQALLGLGGDPRQAFDTILQSPQFKAQQEAAERSLGRRASAFGNLVSGGTLAGLGELNARLANQAIQQQLGNLGQFTQQQRSALSPIAQSQFGQGQLMAGLSQGLGQAEAQALTGAAAARAGGLINQANIGQQQAQGIQSGLFGLGGSVLGAGLMPGGFLRG